MNMKHTVYSRHRGRLFLLILAWILVCGGCNLSETEPPSTSTARSEQIYTKKQVTYGEADAQYSFSRELSYTETAYGRYYFESTLDASLRQACIETTDRVIANLDTVSEKPEICVFSGKSFPGVNVTGNTLYTYQDSYQNVDYVTNVILAACGECTHYGLAYGYAAILCERSGWELSDPANSSTPEVPEVYDLNLLCFDQNFVSEGDVSVARQTARQFAAYLMETYDEEMIRHLLIASQTDTGMEQLCEKLREYYCAQGLDYSPSLLRFGYGGISYSYILKSGLGTFYMGTDWTDAHSGLNPLVTENFLHSGYPETKAFFERNLDQMRSYQELFDLDSYDNDLTVIFPNSRKGFQSSCYQSGAHQILVLILKPN